MAYTKQTWETGQVITAEKLNHMEDGIEGGAVMVLEGTPTYDGNGGYGGTMPFPEAAQQHILSGGIVVLKVLKPDNDNTDNIGFPITATVVGSDNLPGDVANSTRNIYLHSSPIFEGQRESNGRVEIVDNNLTFYANYS